MMRLANISRVAVDSGSVARKLSNVLSNFHDVSNAATKTSTVSESKVVFVRSGMIGMTSTPSGRERNRSLSRRYLFLVSSTILCLRLFRHLVEDYFLSVRGCRCGGLCSVQSAHMC